VDLEMLSGIFSQEGLGHLAAGRIARAQKKDFGFRLNRHSAS
jgi:hypothetical protein